LLLLSMRNFRSRWRWKRPPVRLLLILIPLAFFLVTPCAAREPKGRKVLGLVMEVSPTSLTLMAVDGTDITLIPQEDFTEKVAIGSQVTAWYVPHGGGNELRRLECPLENFFYSAKEIRTVVRRIVVLPTSEVPDASGFFEAVADFLKTSAGWQVEPGKQSEASQPQSSTLEVINAATGEVDRKRAVKTGRDASRRLAAEAHADAVLEIHIEQVEVNSNQYKAAWDGAEETFARGTSRVLTYLSAVPARDEVPAATVVFRLRDARGRMLWSNRRGFAVLVKQDHALAKLRTRTLSEVLTDVPRVQNWFRTVFDSLLPRVVPAGAVPAR